MTLRDLLSDMLLDFKSCKDAIKRPGISYRKAFSDMFDWWTFAITIYFRYKAK